MARLDYDMDNFSGRWTRGTRYDILLDGEVYYHDVPEESVDELALRLSERYSKLGWEADVEVVEL